MRVATGMWGAMRSNLAADNLPCPAEGVQAVCVQLDTSTGAAWASKTGHWLMCTAPMAMPCEYGELLHARACVWVCLGGERATVFKVWMCPVFLGRLCLPYMLRS